MISRNCLGEMSDIYGETICHRVPFLIRRESVNLCSMRISIKSLLLPIWIIVVLILGCSESDGAAVISPTVSEADTADDSNADTVLNSEPTKMVSSNLESRADDQAESDPTPGSEDRPKSVIPELFSTPGDAATSLIDSQSDPEILGSLLSTQATVLAEDPLNESFDVNADIPGTVAAAFTATAEAKPRSEIDNPPDIPATVAAAFTATAESVSQSAVVEPVPYLPTLSEYLEILGTKYTVANGMEQQRQIDNFDRVVSIYVIESELGEVPSTREGFDSVVQFVYNVSAGYYDSHLHKPIDDIYPKWLRIAADSRAGGSIGGFLLEPNLDQAMLLCLVADGGSFGQGVYEKARRPPEPACETAFAEYSAFNVGVELGFVEYLNKRFFVVHAD